MLDVIELEKKWAKYHFKKQLPRYIISFIFLVLAGSASYLYLYQPELVTALLTKPKVDTKPLPVNNVQTKPVATPVVQKTVVEETQNRLKPSFTFLYNLEDQVINYNNTNVVAMASSNKETSTKPLKPKPVKKVEKKKVKPVVKKPKPTPKRTVKKATPKKTKTVKKQIAKQPVKKTPVVIQSQDETLVKVHHDQISADELNSVIKRFNKQKKPALSLFIAKKYYEMGKYKESYHYALVTNKLNPNIEESILIFSRSLVKLGQKEDAISTLQAYIKKSGSFKAKILLSDIEKGNFS